MLARTSRSGRARTRFAPLSFRFALCLSLVAVSPSCGGGAADDGFVVDADTKITLPRGFDAELLYEVPKSQGSWVAMAFDPKGRLLVSDQDDKGVYRVTLPADGRPASDIAVEKMEGFPFVPVAWRKRTVAGALGFLFAFDSLYMSTMKGFYRIRDTDGDDKFDDFSLLKELNPGWEHSAHTITKTPDGKALYLISGNHSRLPKGVRSLQPEVWGLDSLHPALPDPLGHARGVRAPGGWICRISPDGKDWTMIASGLRNAVDVALNEDGELFTYDSDLEFDIGSPWYRPTRVNHVTSASEFGWRAGSAKWPAYFEDSKGSVLDIGPGSPTAVRFGHEAKWPRRYRDKLYLCDWTFGQIHAASLEENGSSYVGKAEVFLHGSPLNITAMRFGPDGQMYFIIGGRNTDSKLYRIRYTGDMDESGAAPTRSREAAELRTLRRKIERLHGAALGAAAIDEAWPQLGHEDRSIRYAARIAIECQDLALWRERVFAEDDARSVVHATIALCRHAGEEEREGLARRVFAKLAQLPFADFGLADRLALLRAYGLCCIRLAKPNAAERSAIIAQIDAFYPSKESALDTELCRLLSYLQAPTVVAKTIRRMKLTQTKAMRYDKEMLARHEYGKSILEAMANTPNSQNIHYAYFLRRVQAGWDRKSRKYYFSWLNDTLAKSGGKSFAGYVRAIREDAIAHLPPAEKATVAWLLSEIETLDLDNLPTRKGPPTQWTTDSAMKLFDKELRRRNYKNGEKMFAAGKCIACHRFRGSGGHCGPDLGSVGKRFSIRDILVAICEPNHTISDQYEASVLTRKDGSSVFGRVIYSNDDEVAIAPDRFDLSKLTKVLRGDVAKLERSDASMMPAGTIDLMNAKEVADLMAYLISGGNKRHRVFR